MKLKYLLLALFVAFLTGFTSCSSDEMIDCTVSKTALTAQLNEHVLLKEIIKKGETYQLNYENNVVELPVSDVAEWVTDEALWETKLTLADGSMYKIPTLGKNIDAFITSVNVNPSKYNPLAANIVLNLPEQGFIQMLLHTKPGNHEPDVTYSFKSVEKNQNITVLGLYPNYTNRVTLIYMDKNKKERARSEVSIPTKLASSIYLPRQINVTAFKADQYEDGMTLVNSWGESLDDTSVPYIIDRDGEIRWVLDWDNHPELKYMCIDCGLTRMMNGNYLTGDANHHCLVEVDVLGNLVHKWDFLAMGYNVHHATSETHQGTILACVCNVSAKIAGGSDCRINDHVVEFDPMHNEIVREFDFATMLDSARHHLTGAIDPKYPFPQSASNWLHNNGILRIGDDYLATGRYQGIFKFTKRGGVKWVISGHEQWRKNFKNILLTPLHADGTPITDPEVIAGRKACEDFDWPWGPHCCVQLPNGHYMVFDNGYGRHYQKISPSFIPYSRAVEYEVDEINMTVRQVWQYGKERGRAFFAPMASSVEYLPTTGNRLIGCADYNILSGWKIGARICEVNPSNNEVIFEVELEGGNFHRVLRLPLYPKGL